MGIMTCFKQPQKHYIPWNDEWIKEFFEPNNQPDFFPSTLRQWIPFLKQQKTAGEKFPKAAKGPQQNHTKSPCTSRGQGMIWVKQSNYQTNVCQGTQLCVGSRDSVGPSRWRQWCHVWWTATDASRGQVGIHSSKMAKNGKAYGMTQWTKGIENTYSIGPPKVCQPVQPLCFWWKKTGSNLETRRFYNFSCFRSCK